MPPMTPPMENSKPATSTPRTVQPIIAISARRLRKPFTAWNRLENAVADNAGGQNGGRRLVAHLISLVVPYKGTTRAGSSRFCEAHPGAVSTRCRAALRVP